MNMKNDPDRKKGHLTPTDWTLNVTGPKGSTHRYKPMLEQLCVTAASPDLKLCFTCTFLSIKIYSRVETAFLEKLVNFLKTRDKLKSVVCWFYSFRSNLSFYMYYFKNRPSSNNMRRYFISMFMSEKFSYQQWKSCRMFTTSDPSATVLLYLNQLFLRFSVYCWNNKN